MVAPTDPRGWIGVDFDGTLADYARGWRGPHHAGPPITLMVERVKAARVKVDQARYALWLQAYAIDATFIKVKAGSE